MLTGWKLGFANGWLLSLPFLVLLFSMVGMKQKIIKRLSDMTGYTQGEKFFTISASLAPYPFLLAATWLPFTSIKPLFTLGLVFYAAGLILSGASLKAIIKTPPGRLFAAGPYRFSRNPMYVSASLVFIGICLATASAFLAGYLAVALLLQHFMILAEERVCQKKFGKAFTEYFKKVPRYLFIF